MPHRDPADVVDHFVALVLGHIDREYPNKLDHVMNGPEQVKGPRDLHPIFYGSYDWHSSVHGHWLLIRALRLFPKLAQRTELIALLDKRFNSDAVKVELEYLSQKRRETFERTYGWAWFLKLAAELREPGALADAAAPFDRWRIALQPLTDAFVERYLKFLPKATYPIRVGTHQNTAFGLALAHDYARVSRHTELTKAIVAKARAWYEKDQNYPAWEPDGSDFLSPGLVEAECMRRVLGDGFIQWLDRFLPNLDKGEPVTLFTPATVSDRTDGQITHLDGLNLSRAWCFRSIASALDGSRQGTLKASFDKHLDSALPHVSGDYMGEHWLATFALLAMTE